MGEMLHCPQGGSARVGSPQPLSLSLKCIESERCEAIHLGTEKNITVVFTKKRFEMISLFGRSFGSEAFSNQGV